MPGQFIISTPRGQLEALGYQGILATDSHAQLAALLESRLSRAHALALAEPVHDPGRQVVDWYTEAVGERKALSGLAPDQRSAALARLNGLLADMRGLAAELLQSPDGPKNVRGQILSLALQYPGDDQVYVVGDQPVIVGWGCAPTAGWLAPAEVSRLGAALPPVPLTADNPRSGRWWRTLLKTLLPLFILYCLAALFWGPPVCHESYPFGFRPPGFEGCFKPVEPLTAIPAPNLTHDQDEALNAALDEEVRLRAEYDRQRAKLAELVETCRPAPETPPEPETPKSGDKLTIPKEAREMNDLKFLDGCWVCESGVSNRRSGQPIVIEFCFAAQGRGRVTIEDPDNGLCKGAAQANFESAALKIQQEKAPCSKKGRGYYSPALYKCVEENGEVRCMCKWEGGGNEHEAVFRRK